MDGLNATYAADARALVDQIGALYVEFARQCESAVPPKSPFRLFEKWFHSASPEAPPEDCERFLRTAAALSQALAAALPILHNTHERETLALDAIKIMLKPKPLHDKSQREWYLVAAESSAAALLIFLSLTDLNALKADYRRANPRHMMYPCQRRLLRDMERLADAGPPGKRR